MKCQETARMVVQRNTMDLVVKESVNASMATVTKIMVPATAMENTLVQNAKMTANATMVTVEQLMASVIALMAFLVKHVTKAVIA